MALTMLSPLTANFTQPLTTNIITTNFTTLPFLTLSNDTANLTFLMPDPSIFSTDPTSALFDSFNSNNNTFTEYDYTFDNNGTVVANSSSSNGNTDDYTTNTEEEEVNPFLANDYNFYDYNPYDPNATLSQEPYDYSDAAKDSNSEESMAKRDEALKKWDGVNYPPPIRPIAYNALTDLNPWFLWTPPIFCLLALILITLPCIILKIRDDNREKHGKSRKYGSVRRKSILRQQIGERIRADDLERQAVAVSAPLTLSGNAYSGIQYIAQVTPKPNGQKKSQVKNSRVSPGLVTENVLYIEENDLSKKKENGKVVSKRLAVDEPPVDYGVDEEILAPRRPSKEEEGAENLETHRHSSSSGSLTPAEEAAASGVTSLGSSSGPERRAEEDDGSGEEEDEEVRAHRSGNFSTAPKTYIKFTGWNRDLYSNGAGAGPVPPVRKSSSKQEGGSPPGGMADPDWGMY